MIKKILVKIGQNWSKFGVDLKTRFSPVVFDWPGISILRDRDFEGVGYFLVRFFELRWQIIL